ncbi:MAG TPA: molybdate ABC transporter substrate-binding protein [Candidatus Limnocylindrales bacterium]|nr:molybdate ABC transporter substrate-binding protein [Candidatus Limnocylindrales bacterium]
MRPRQVLRPARAVSAILAIALTASAACGSRAAGQAPTELIVFAAASLRDAFTATAAEYRATAPGVILTFSFDASSALRTQIELGAPADAFASADTVNPQALVDGGYAVGPVAPFARNLLTIVVPLGNPAAIRDPRELARPGVRIVGAGEAVPISRYVDACLERLALLPGFPAGYAAAVERNVVSREDNVRAALTKVELGEADAAIVYVTDARSSHNVETVAIPASANVEATYGAVTARGSRHPVEAAAFVMWLTGPRGRAVLAPFGFLGPAGE